MNERSMRNQKELTSSYLRLQAFPQSENRTLVNGLARAPLEEHDHGTFIVTPFCGLVISESYEGAVK